MRFEVYPRQAKRLITDPVKGIFVPLIVSLLGSNVCDCKGTDVVLRFCRLRRSLLGQSIMSYPPDIYLPLSFIVCFGTSLPLLWTRGCSDQERIAGFMLLSAFLSASLC